MFFTRFYYQLKPMMPLALRIALRRRWARAQKAAHQAVWPINPAAATPPENWKGWPEGKKFAVVLTHDVESSRGLNRCTQLMELERSLGFRSSFNLIPEGGYRDFHQLRRTLTENGFEVGVHDLYHDGKLFSSRSVFQERAALINKHLKDWGASGFRSGFMLNNLDWLHDLHIQYDASTFDSDPFEPQPYGVSTIFPFWIPRPGSGTSHSQPSTINSQLTGVPRPGSGSQPTSDLRLPTSAAGSDSQPPVLQSLGDGGSTLNPQREGYIELPYTLVQDFTLFVILQERTIDIWKRKVDWIVQQGGMVLLDTHPDYMAFAGSTPRADEFPVALYAELLRYIKEKYAGEYYHALPAEVAKFAAEFRPQRQNPTPKRICMVAYSAYESDNRVMRYSEALAQQGHLVEALAVKREHSQPDSEMVGNVQVHRLQSRETKNQQKPSSYLLPLLKFQLRATFWLARQHLRNRFDLVHVHNMPDFLVFAALIPRLTGAKVILDIHDIVPEFYASKFHTGADTSRIRLLKRVEKLAAGFAHHVILSNHLWFKKFVSRSASAEKCSVFINNVDRSVFFPRERTAKTDKRIIIFPGGLQWHQGLDIAIKAFNIVQKQLPDVEFHIYGDGNMKNELVALVGELGLSQKVLFHKPMPLRRIAEVMANADLGVVPKRSDSFGNEAYSTKIMEFMSLGVPVVISRTKIDTYYFNDSVARFFESGNVQELADAMVEVLGNHAQRHQMIQNALDYAERNSWDVKKHEYLKIVDTLVGNRRAN